MEVETLDVRQLGEADLQGIAELLFQVWPKSKKTVDLRRQQLIDLGRLYEGDDAQAPRCFVVREAGRIIAHSTFVPRLIQTTDGPLTIAGLALVCSAPEQRGRGLGEAVVRPFFRLIDEGVFRFSLFQTSAEVRSFYEQLGALVVDNPIVNSKADNSAEAPFAGSVVMRYPSGEGWPEGEIDLCGPSY